MTVRAKGFHVANITGLPFLRCVKLMPLDEIIRMVKGGPFIRMAIAADCFTQFPDLNRVPLCDAVSVGAGIECRQQRDKRR
jgi:hypothetical protein